MVQITLEDNAPILATDQHPFWSETRAAYVPAVEIYKGEELRDTKNSRTIVRSTRVYTQDLLAYNLTIRNIHTYYAGESPVLVHNCGGNRSLVAKERLSAWDKGTFQNKTSSIKYHFQKHGRGRTLGQYLDDARKWQKVDRRPGMYRGRPGGIVSREGRLYSFW